MKEFIIKVDQLQTILDTLGEFPAKKVIQVIDMIRQLPEHKKEVDNK
jgi:hypothetical protein